MNLRIAVRWVWRWQRFNLSSIINEFTQENIIEFRGEHGMKFLFFCFVAAFFLVASHQQADAYLDPGTGSMIVQAVIAAVAAVGFGLSVFRARVKAFFGRLFGKGEKK